MMAADFSWNGPLSTIHHSQENKDHRRIFHQACSDSGARQLTSRVVASMFLKKLLKIFQWAWFDCCSEGGVEADVPERAACLAKVLLKRAKWKK